jgi:hypothetical protein
MTQITIALSGLSKTDAAVFEAALGVLPDDLWRLAAPTHAELVVIDADTVAGHAKWARASSGAATLAAYTRNRKLQGGELVLSKPLRTRDLADLITRLREGMSASASNEEAPPPAANMPHAPESARERPAGASTRADTDIEGRQNTASAPAEGHAGTSSGTLGDAYSAPDYIASEQAPAHDDKAGRGGRGLLSRLRRAIGRDG